MTHEDTFEQARKLYPGTKRGLPTELDNFKKHKDWKEVLSLLVPAIEAQIQWRKTANGEFREAWKHFRTWINQRWWEVDLPETVETDKKTKLYPIKGKSCGKQGCSMPAVHKNINGTYDSYRCLEHAPQKVREMYC